MTITKRLSKGSTLTHLELDSNFDHLTDRISSVESSVGSVQAAAARLVARSTSSSGSAGVSLFHTGAREYLLKTDTGDGSILRLGHGIGDGNISTQWLVLSGTTTRIFFGGIEVFHISGTVGTETVYRMQADPTNKVISQEWFRTVDDITNPANYERIQLITDQVTASTFTLRTEALGTGTVRDFEILRGATLHFAALSTSTRLGAIVKLGTPSETNAVAGDLVLANDRELRGANAANNGNFHLIGMNSSDQVKLGHDGVAVKLGDATDLAFGTTTGTKIGTAANQKLAFYNATPIVQQTGVAVTAAAIHAALVNLGLITA